MRVIFADTVYWIAISNPRDSLHRSAVELPLRLGEHRIVTSEMVLVEVLNNFSGEGSRFRRIAASLVQRITDNEDIDVVPQTPQYFRDAFALYHARLDKNWSLTDCASFVIMEERQITEALTHDRHFEQCGYQALLRA